MMGLQEMLLYLIQHVTFQVDKLAAFFAFQVEVFLAGRRAPDKLVTGASLFQGVAAYHPVRTELFQMAVHRRLAYGGRLPPEVLHYLVYGNVPIAQRVHIVEDAPALPGLVMCRTAVHTTSMRAGGLLCQSDSNSKFNHFSTQRVEKSPSRTMRTKTIIEYGGNHKDRPLTCLWCRCGPWLFRN